MISLITGVPGSGKSLTAVEWIVAARKEGRAVYADIDGLQVDGVLPSPLDWRDTPEGSLVVYDEAQKTYPSTGRPGVSEDERIRALETHRHTGHDLVFITQAPSLIHHHIRKLVGKHVHVHRAAGMKRATRYTWDFAVEAPNDRKEQQRADAENWFYPKGHFGKYKSATVHTHKFNVPKKIMWILALLVIIVGFVGYRVFANDGLAVLHLTDDVAEAAATEAAGPAPLPGGSSGNGWSDAPPVTSIIGCVGTETTCRCFGQDGNQLDLELAQCLNVMSKPLPTNVLRFSQQTPAGGVGGSPPTGSPLTQALGRSGGGGGPRGIATEPSQVGPPETASEVW